MLEIAKISYIYQEKMLKRTEYFILDCINNVIEIYDNYLSKPSVINLTSIEIETVVEHLLSLTFGWDAYYENSNVTDGFQWHFVIESKSQEKIEYSGQNKLPSNFQQVKKIIEELRDAGE